MQALEGQDAAASPKPPTHCLLRLLRNDSASSAPELSRWGHAGHYLAPARPFVPLPPSLTRRVPAHLKRPNRTFFLSSHGVLSSNAGMDANEVLSYNLFRTSYKTAC
ncbi:hypothetical protein TSOC_009223 [Tetrabaena socialis]|uniref:Uncharacterized protein n=1 Tax=Tetrabaena socialis TaxID=47790 RepID=A0A2J7ZWF0_9CHLO|nr:hypothetical protein TSOC_009223 [Tetrabaena socialis]|eukprot:PNH04584.1 hypothetical protein TSOC_009223 [Tetrabaena socialis]